MKETSQKAKSYYTNKQKNTTSLSKYAPICISDGRIPVKRYQVTIQNSLMEHFSALFPNKTRTINDMEEINFTEKEVYNKIKNSKNGKATGPDGLKN